MEFVESTTATKDLVQWTNTSPSVRAPIPSIGPQRARGPASGRTTRIDSCTSSLRVRGCSPWSFCVTGRTLGPPTSVGRWTSPNWLNAATSGPTACLWTTHPRTPRRLPLQCAQVQGRSSVAIQLVRSGSSPALQISPVTAVAPRPRTPESYVPYRAGRCSRCLTAPYAPDAPCATRAGATSPPPVGSTGLPPTPPRKLLMTDTDNEYGSQAAIDRRQRARGFDPDNIEQWFWVRAQWVVDLLRSGMNVAVIGKVGIGKSITMHHVEDMLAEHGLTDRVRFFSDWEGSSRLPRRAPRRAVRRAVELDRLPAGDRARGGREAGPGGHARP